VFYHATDLIKKIRWYLKNQVSERKCLVHIYIYIYIYEIQKVIIDKTFFSCKMNQYKKNDDKICIKISKINKKEKYASVEYSITVEFVVAKDQRLTY
jgi:hypothetical protein